VRYGFQTASSPVDIGTFDKFRFVPILLSVNRLTRHEIRARIEADSEPY
jgi:hypothetical protein